MSVPRANSLADLLDRDQRSFVELARKRIRSVEGYDDAFLQQAYVGFANLVRAAIDGDLEPRDHYVEGLVRGVQDNALGFEYVMRGMTELAVILTEWACDKGATDSLPWLAEFLGDYAMTLVQVYGE